jgi:hypothetical protein
MSSARFAAPLLLAFAAAAQAPLPELRIEPIGGGSIFYIHNTAPQPVTAYLIELVNYPGSTYWYPEDDPNGIIPSGGEKRIQVTNMTVGAVPDYVKMQAALFADGTSAGIPEKIAQLIARRRSVLETTRELIRRCEKGPNKEAVIDDLKKWSDSMPVARSVRSFEASNREVPINLISATIKRLVNQSVEATVAALRISERTLAASKPAL